MAQARATGLARDRQWLLLGHWRETASGALESEVDGADFFLSPRGKRDPEAELEATIRGMVSPHAFEGEVHPICKFRARLLYLQHRLGLDMARMPQRRCERFEEYRDRLDARALIFVFSSYYLNNPASAFGHTFFRIEKKGALTGRRDLLDYGVDYSATLTTRNAVIYAIKGVAGMFKGEFRRMPYYYKVRQYNDAESRDLWEYELGLSPAELDMFIAHLWELGGTWFEYWYLSENCSYHILAALEVAYPTADLTSGLGVPVIPSDTVKAIMDTGLVKKVTYRPSLRTVFRRRIAAMGDSERDAVEDLYDDPDAPLPELTPVQRAGVFDAAADLVDMRDTKQVLAGTGTEADKKKQRLLERRAEVPVVSADVSVTPPNFRRPHTGHDSHRLALGAGSDVDGVGFMTFEGRLALHDILDPPRGYPELSQLEFLPTRMRLSEDGEVRLDDLALVHALSLAPQDRFDRRLSFRIRFSLTRIDDEGCECLGAGGEMGGGATFAWFDDRLAIWLLTESHLRYNPDLIGIDIGDDTLPWRLGVGPFAGVRVRLGERLVTMLSGTWLWLPLQIPTSTWKTTATMRLALSSWFALDLEGRMDPAATEARLATMIYF